MKKNEIREQVAIAVKACQEKKAEEISILRLDAQSSGFTDYFVICSGANPRQVQAIADDIDLRLSAIGVEPKHVEGYQQAEWLLLDYVDFVVHIFSQSARKFYDLERLWKSATRLTPADLEKPERKPAGKKAATGVKPAKTSARKPASSEKTAGKRSVRESAKASSRQPAHARKKASSAGKRRSS